MKSKYWKWRMFMDGGTGAMCVISPALLQQEGLQLTSRETIKRSISHTIGRYPDGQSSHHAEVGDSLSWWSFGECVQVKISRHYCFSLLTRNRWLHDVREKITRALSRCSKLRHILDSPDLPLPVKLRPYQIIFCRMDVRPAWCGHWIR